MVLSRNCPFFLGVADGSLRVFCKATYSLCFIYICFQRNCATVIVVAKVIIVVVAIFVEVVVIELVVDAVEIVVIGIFFDFFAAGLTLAVVIVVAVGECPIVFAAIGVAFAIIVAANKIITMRPFCFNGIKIHAFTRQTKCC